MAFNKRFLGKPNLKITNWCKEHYSIGQEPLSFTSTIPGAYVSFDGTSDIKLEYSTDNKQTWNEYKIGDRISLTTQAYFRCPAGHQNEYAPKLNTSGYDTEVEAHGSVMTLLTKNGSLTIPSDACFAYWAGDCRGLTKAPELPATELTKYCYDTMFFGCHCLTSIPELPATTLAEYCYVDMFEYCQLPSTLEANLPATTLAEHCYDYMFFQSFREGMSVCHMKACMEDVYDKDFHGDTYANEVKFDL